jgi:hypothetical protein
VRFTEASGTIPENELLRRAVPELSSVLNDTREALLQSSAKNQYELIKHLCALSARQANTAASLNALVNGQIPIMIQCQGIGLIGAQPAQLTLLDPAQATAGQAAGQAIQAAQALQVSICPNPPSFCLESMLTSCFYL